MKRPLLVAATILSSLPCQQTDEPELRGRAFGIARQQDRSPWSDATVTLLSQPFPGCQDRDIIETRTDATGRFTAQILIGRAYVAWARSALETEWRVSGVVDDIVPHLPVVLDEGSREPRVHVQLRGLEPWREPGPMQLWCAGAGDQHGALPMPVGAAEIELPPTGTGERWLFLTAGNGLDVFRHQVAPDVRGTFELVVPAPIELAIDVLEPDRTPVVGARIRVRSPTGALLRGSTDATGRLVAQIPGPSIGVDQPRFLPLWAEADGHLTGRLWRLSAPASGPCTIFVQPATTVDCRLMFEDGQPLDRVPVWISGVESSIEPQQAVGGPMLGRPNPQFATDGYQTTDRAGKLTIGYARDYPVSLGVLLPARQLRSLAAQLGATPNPLALIWAGKPAAANEIIAHVDRLRAVRCLVRRSDGSPAQGAHMRLGAGASPGIGLGFVADQAGAVTILLPVCDDIMLAAWHGAEGEVFKIAVPAKAAAAPAITDVALELPRHEVVRGTVYGRDGRPAVGVEVALKASLRGPHGEWQLIAPPADATSPHISARGYHYPAMAMAMYPRSARTDENGCYCFDLPSLVFPLRVAVPGQHGVDLVDQPRTEAGVVEVDLELR